MSVIYSFIDIYIYIHIYTTGTAAGSVRNMGATVVAQTIPLTAGLATSATTLCSLPAGAVVTNVQFITTTTFGSATTLKVTINGTDWASAATITTAGYYPQTGASTAVPVVGSTDSLVTYTGGGTATTGAVTVVIAYVVRNSDGSIAPSYSQG